MHNLVRAQAGINVSSCAYSFFVSWRKNSKLTHVLLFQIDRRKATNHHFFDQCMQCMPAFLLYARWHKLIES